MSVGGLIYFSVVFIVAGVYGSGGENGRDVHGNEDSYGTENRWKRDEIYKELDKPWESSVNYEIVHSLHLHILQSYNHLIRPGIGMGKELICNFSMIITHLDDVDEDKQTVDLHGWVILQWYDERLCWNGSRDFNSINKTMLPQRLIWKPDLHLYNNAQSKLDTLISTGTMAHIYRDGRVTVDPPISLRAYCAFDYTRFPWDQQHCTVALGSWAYRTQELKWRLSSKLASNSSFLYKDSHRMYSMNWLISSASLELADVEFESELWHYVHIVFTLERASAYAAGFILVPASIYSVLTPVAFLLTTTNGGRWKLIVILVALAIEILHLLALYSRLPALVFNGMPKSITLCITSTFITVSVFLLALITNCLSECTTHSPTWLDNICRHPIINSGCCFFDNSGDRGSFHSSSKRRRQNIRHSILVTNQTGVTKRIQAPYADDSEFASTPPSSPRTPHDSFRAREHWHPHRFQETTWIRLAVVLDRSIFLICTLAYAVLWLVCVGLL